MDKENTFKRTLLSGFGKARPLFLLAIMTIIALINQVKAYAFEIPATSNRFQFPKIDELLGSLILTIQCFAGGVAILIVAFSGLKVMTASYSTRAMEEVKSSLGKVFVGAVIVFLAISIVKIITDALGVST